MAYATIQDMVDCYGEEEVVCLTDKSQPRTKAINTVRAQCMLDRACAEIDLKLACCGFNVKEIKRRIAEEGVTFPILHHWNLAVARYLLYDKIRLNVNANGSDHEAHRRYKDYEQEIEDVCKHCTLVDSDGCAVMATMKHFAVKDEGSCLPRNMCCCKSDPCCCGGIGY
jgi:phage gp36-like protein